MFKVIDLKPVSSALVLAVYGASVFAQTGAL
jgi:hypothetical protein